MFIGRHYIGIPGKVRDTAYKKGQKTLGREVWGCWGSGWGAVILCAVCHGAAPYSLHNGSDATKVTYFVSEAAVGARNQCLSSCMTSKHYVAVTMLVGIGVQPFLRQDKPVLLCMAVQNPPESTEMTRTHVAPPSPLGTLHNMTGRHSRELLARYLLGVPES